MIICRQYSKAKYTKAGAMATPIIIIFFAVTYFMHPHLMHLYSPCSMDI